MSKLREAVEALLAVRDDYDGSDVRAFLVNNEAAIASLRAALAADDEGDIEAAARAFQQEPIMRHGERYGEYCERVAKAIIAAWRGGR